MKVLVIAVHIDDAECLTGTMAQLIDKGAEVTYLNIKHYQHYKGNNPIADAQSMRGAELIGAKKIILDYNIDKYYRTNGQSIRDTEQVIRDINPDIIFIMHPEDNHIEHVECAHTAREAIFAAAVDGYIPNEIYSFATGPKQSMCYFEPDIYIDVEEKLDDIKRVFLNFCAENANGERLWNSERVSKEYRGLECGLKYADGFKITKYPSGSNDFLLREVLCDKFRWAGNKMYYIGSKMFL
jgi:LmbE family N-acetylglucosaminyl deacetylase